MLGSQKGIYFGSFENDFSIASFKSIVLLPQKLTVCSSNHELDPFLVSRDASSPSASSLSDLIFMTVLGLMKLELSRQKPAKMRKYTLFLFLNKVKTFRALNLSSSTTFSATANFTLAIERQNLLPCLSYPNIIRLVSR